MPNALRFRISYFSPLGRHQAVLWAAPDTPPVPASIDLGDKAEQSFPLGAFRHDIAALKAGRFYPIQMLVAEHPEAPMFRVREVNGESFTASFNHPLRDIIFSVDSGPAESASPGLGSIAQLLEWPGMETPGKGRRVDYAEDDAFARDDESPDPEFYAEPRRVIHVDGICAKRIAAIYRTLLPPGARTLDLMAGWRSHLPDTLGEVVGLGLNAAEVADNPQLTRHVVHDLNVDPVLPFDTASFDAVVCSLSVEYLTQPHAAMREIRRVLKPGGALAIALSNRYFPPKVTRLWTRLHPMERLGWVASLLKGAGFAQVETYVERGLARDPNDRYADQVKEADPLFAVWGIAPLPRDETVESPKSIAGPSQDRLGPSGGGLSAAKSRGNTNQLTDMPHAPHWIMNIASAMSVPSPPPPLPEGEGRFSRR
jgi:SAM-dependent methyltransferase